MGKPYRQGAKPQRRSENRQELQRKPTFVFVSFIFHGKAIPPSRKAAKTQRKIGESKRKRSRGRRIVGVISWIEFRQITKPRNHANKHEVGFLAYFSLRLCGFAPWRYGFLMTNENWQMTYGKCIGSLPYAFLIETVRGSSPSPEMPTRQTFSGKR